MMVNLVYFPVLLILGLQARARASPVQRQPGNVNQIRSLTSGGSDVTRDRDTLVNLLDVFVSDFQDDVTGGIRNRCYRPQSRSTSSRAGPAWRSFTTFLSSSGRRTVSPRSASWPRLASQAPVQPAWVEMALSDGEEVQGRQKRQAGRRRKNTTRRGRRPPVRSGPRCPPGTIDVLTLARRQLRSNVSRRGHFIP